MTIRLFMPKCGEEGVIIATDAETGFVVEFRGTPYSKWVESEDSAFCKVHSAFKRVDISRMHSCEEETVTKWHGEEYTFIRKMFDEATRGY